MTLCECGVTLAPTRTIEDHRRTSQHHLEYVRRRQVKISAPVPRPVPSLLLPKKEVRPEEWTEIDDFPRYSVSTRGRVRNNESGRFLGYWKDGYRWVHLTMNGSEVYTRISCLMAQHFPRQKNKENK